MLLASVSLAVRGPDWNIIFRTLPRVYSAYLEEGKRRDNLILSLSVSGLSSAQLYHVHSHEGMREEERKHQ